MKRIRKWVVNKAYNRAYNKKYTADHIARGLCVSCKEPTRPNRRHCQVCADKNNASARERKVERALYWRIKRRAARKLTVEALGGKCVSCGFSDFRGLEIDHVNNDGIKDKHLKHWQIERYYQKIREDKEGSYQILCGTCHNIKSYEETWTKK